MKVTALQNLLGLYALVPHTRTLVEALVALLAAMVAVGLRRRTSVIRPTSLSMISAGLLCDAATLFVKGLPNLHAGLEAISLVLVAFGLIRLLLEGADITMRRGRADSSTIFKDLLTILLYAIVVAVVLRLEFKVDVEPLLASGAVLTVVVGLALQETLGNIFSGLTIQLQKPFGPGDWVRTTNYVGRVLGVGWRSTSVVTLANERLDIPNAMIAKDVLVNYASAAVRDEISVGISYLEPPNRVREVIANALRDIPGVLHHPEPQIFAWEYGESAIHYRVKYWLGDYGLREIVRDRVTTALWYVLRRHAMEIPFPIRTLQVRHTRRERDSERAFERAIINELRRVDFLRELNDEELRMLSLGGRVHQFGAGEVLVRQGDPGDSFFILRRGRVEVMVHSDDGREAHVATLVPPTFFGEIALMTGEARNATVRAHSDAEVLEMDREAFTHLFHNHPEVAAKMGEVIATRLTERRDILAAMPESDGNRARRNWLMAKMRAVFDF